jgi:hypothetical protein
MNNKTLFMMIVIIIFLCFIVYKQNRINEKMTTDTSTDDVIDSENTGDDYMTSLSTISLEQSDDVKIKIYNTVSAIRDYTKKLSNHKQLKNGSKILIDEIIDFTDEILIADEYDPEMETKPSIVDGSAYLLADRIRELGYKLQKVTTDSGIYDMGISIESNGKQLALMHKYN